ncbi:unnamed protein product [Pelagomonas calceolata]|uniref:Uncharacterized protein n=1 Tax=Pelagomonas calceolata TaxID=35677 RepID=A0A8J2X0A8_9STRA|nr:unnamed protein product [Pelagomonas calceolata]
MRNQSPGTALRFYRARTPISTRYSSSSKAKTPPPLPKCFQTRHPVSYPPVSMIPANARQPVDYAAGGRFQKQTDATGREYLVDKLTGAWTPVAELTNNAPVSPLRNDEDAAMPTRPSACHPSATTSHKKRGRDEMGPFRTGKPADDDTSIVSSENSQKSLHDEVAQLRARLDAVERRTAADLLAMETVISWLKDNNDRTQASLESLARGVTP